MLYGQNQEDTEANPRGSYVWEEGGTPRDLRFTNYPACLRASLQTRKMDLKWLEKLNHKENTDGKIDGVRNTHTIWN